MPAIQIGKYKRPGIFIEEFNDSVIETPNVTGIQSLVIGSSKKGPINTPVNINSQIELERVFGDLDRTLEANGSYFHRTISKLLENTPVVAMNILNVDNDLDQIEYKSLSTSSGNKNDVKEIAPYSRFFDTSTFWKRDREAFLGITKDNDGDEKRILHFTNLNDRQITVFIVKSQNTAGFDRTLLNWYGSGDKVPVYLDERDFASDYLVDVVVLSGDWTNYNQLSVDPNWSQYFNNSGLIKDQLFNLTNDQTINTLGVWRNLSLIPFFRDANGANIFIEDRINQRTDQTGLFCAFDIDAVETTFRNGLLDLVGNSLIGEPSPTASITPPESIDFLSYKENITETISYPETKLDTPGNVLLLGFNDSYQNTTSERKALFAESYVNGLAGIGATAFSGITGPTGQGIAPINIDFTDIPLEDIYGVIGGEVLGLTSTSFSYTPDDIPNLGSTESIALYIDTDGVIKDTTDLGILAGSEIVLGLLEVTAESFGSGTSSVNYFENMEYTPITVDNNGFIYFDSTTEITATFSGDQLIYEFLDTTGVPDIADPKTFRQFKLFNDIIAVLDNTNSDRSTILINPISGSNDFSKKPFSELSLHSDTTSSTGNNNKIVISGFDDILLSSNLVSDGLVLHTVDNEMLIGLEGLRTTNDIPNDATFGVVGKYSDLYLDYTNGIVNTNDYFINDFDAEKNYMIFYKVNEDLFVDYGNIVNSSTQSGFNIVSQDSNFRQSIEIEEPVGHVSVPNKILISSSRYPEVKVGDFLQAVVPTDIEIGEIPRRMTRIINKKQYSGDTSLTEITCDSEIYFDEFNGDKQTKRFTQIDDYVSAYKGINLFGFRVRNESLPNNKDSRLDDIMNIVQKGTPLFNAITDKDIIDFRYLVDSYGLGLSSTSKQQLADICGKRLDCFGILNMPSIKQFRNSSSPSFLDSENRLSVEFISLGGNPETSAAFNYSLAEGNGSTTVGYFTPYVIVNDNGRPKEVPPAAYVATTFLRKHNTSLTSVTPWTIAAGITDGQVTGIGGLEHSFTSSDIEFLNGMSVNPIISKRNRGRVIETENTAETLANSALGLIHVREVLIELERDLSDMLLNFQWKFNTPEVRSEIKMRADVICEDYVNRNGLFNFFNKIDNENNTQEIIDNQIGVLDTFVEPVKGMGIIINNITILNTGGIESNGFL